MAITFDKLVAGTKASAKAVFAATKTDKYVLPVADLDMITEMMNENNPLSFYTSGVKVTSMNSGSVDVEFDVYNDNFKKKTTKGSATDGGDDVIIETQNIKWNTPLTKEESMSAYDIKRGAPEVLGSRMANSAKKFIQASIKNGFKAIVAHNKADASEVSIAPIDITSLDKLREYKISLIQKVTLWSLTNEIPKEETGITLEPTLFDALAEQGMIGDRATATYAGGQYSVGTMGGYKVQSGEIFLPAKDSAAQDAKDLFAVVGTTKTALHAIEYVAANLGALGNSNDQGTYLELCDIFGALDYNDKFGKTQSLNIISA